MNATIEILEKVRRGETVFAKGMCEVLQNIPNLIIEANEGVYSWECWDMETPESTNDLILCLSSIMVHNKNQINKHVIEGACELVVIAEQGYGDEQDYSIIYVGTSLQQAELNAQTHDFTDDHDHFRVQCWNIGRLIKEIYIDGSDANKIIGLMEAK